MTDIALLSFIPPSYMVVPIRESANLNSVTYLAIASSSEIKGSENCEMSSVWGRFPLPSAISSRGSSSNSKAFSIEYSTYVGRTNNVNTNWANQMDGEIFHIPLSSQREREFIPQAQAALNSNSPSTHIDLISNMEQEQAINSLSPPVFLYEELQLANNNSWDSRTNLTSLFRRLRTQDIDVNNIKISLERISDFIANCHLNNHKEDKIPCLTGFGKVAFDLVSSIFKGGWDILLVGDGQKSFCNKFKKEFTTKVPTVLQNKKSNRLPPAKPVEFSNILPMNPTIPVKGDISSKNKGKNIPNSINSVSKTLGSKCSYAQVSSAPKVRKILKLKKNFPKLSNKKIEQIHNTVTGSNTPVKTHINMTTKGPSRKQIIIPMDSDNARMFMTTAGDYVININHTLKGIKSDVIANFIRLDFRGLIVVANKVPASSDISIINNYVKNSFSSDANNIQDARLPQSKSYLKILGIPYLMENTNTPMDSNIMENIIKASHIFNDIKIASKPCICKVSLKSDMAIVWIDIWDSQNGLAAKRIINRSFNIGNFVATIRGTNMNLGIPQCKNCWKWGHTTFACCFQGSRCIKYNGPYKSKHHRHFGWCYKTNPKTNPPRLKTKQGELCPHTFKCINCKGDHQADSNNCLF